MRLVDADSVVDDRDCRALARGRISPVAWAAREHRMGLRL
jgi:hypothetical protein